MTINDLRFIKRKVCLRNRCFCLFFVIMAIFDLLARRRTIVLVKLATELKGSGGGGGDGGYMCAQRGGGG